MLAYLKSTFSDGEGLSQEKYIEQSIAWHGKRAVIENQNYTIDRLWK